MLAKWSNEVHEVIESHILILDFDQKFPRIGQVFKSLFIVRDSYQGTTEQQNCYRLRTLINGHMPDPVIDTIVLLLFEAVKTMFALCDLLLFLKINF